MRQGRDSVSPLARRPPANQPDPWERQPGESRPAWSAFQTFLELSAVDPTKEATYEHVAEAVGKNKSLISRWARVARNGLNWRDRRDAWLAHVDRARAARLMRETEQARERWRHTGRTMQQIGASKIETINPLKLDADEARRFVIDGSQLESRGLGLDSRQPLQITQTNQTAHISIDPELARRLAQNFLERKTRDVTVEPVGTDKESM